MEGGGGYQIREEAVRYISLFGAEKADIAPEKTYFWDVISRIYTRCFGPTPDASGRVVPRLEPVNNEGDKRCSKSYVTRPL